MTMTQSTIYIYHKIQWKPLQTGKTYAVNVKTCSECRKTKMVISIFLNKFFYNNIKLTAMRTFFQESNYFFVLYHYFEMETIVLYDFDSAFYYFYRYYERRGIKVDAIFFVIL